MSDGAPDPYRFTEQVWLHAGDAAWHFVSMPPDLAERIRNRDEGYEAPFGSIRVEARIGGTSWLTSIFYDTKRGTYLLPVKAAVRRAEGVGDGDPVEVEIRLADP